MNLSANFCARFTPPRSLTIFSISCSCSLVKYFPNLTIIYGEYVNLTPAVTITFMSDSKDVIENNKVHYKVLGPNRNLHNKSISDLISD